MNFYEILQVERHATSEELRAAYLRRVQETHPDRLSPESDHQIDRAKDFPQIQEAYEVLRDPQLRREYDLSLVTSLPDRRVFRGADRGVIIPQYVRTSDRSPHAAVSSYRSRFRVAYRGLQWLLLVLLLIGAGCLVWFLVLQATINAAASAGASVVPAPPYRQTAPPSSTTPNEENSTDVKDSDASLTQSPEAEPAETHPHVPSVVAASEERLIEKEVTEKEVSQKTNHHSQSTRHSASSSRRATTRRARNRATDAPIVTVDKMSAAPISVVPINVTPKNVTPMKATPLVMDSSGQGPHFSASATASYLSTTTFPATTAPLAIVSPLSSKNQAKSSLPAWNNSSNRVWGERLLEGGGDRREDWPRWRSDESTPHWSEKSSRHLDSSVEAMGMLTQWESFLATQNQGGASASTSQVVTDGNSMETYRFERPGGSSPPWRTEPEWKKQNWKSYRSAGEPQIPEFSRPLRTGSP